MPLPSIDAWEVELLRVTCFTSDAIPSERSEEWWRAIVDAAPEQSVRKPALGVFSMDGPVDEVRLSLNVTPGRIDWFLVPDIQQNAESLSLGRFVGRDQRFTERLGNWLQRPQITVQRVAYGAVLRLPVESRVAGYRVLRDALQDVRVDPDTWRDFSYQINRPRESQQIRNVLVNRLSKWGVLQVEMTLMPNGRSISNAHFVRLELDVSSDKSSQVDLSIDRGVSRLIEEFRSMGREIATGGDIA